MKFYKTIKQFLLIGLFLSTSALANNDQTFYDWLISVRADAKANNISDETIDRTFKNAEFLSDVILLDRSQPEFISTFLDYLEKRVTVSRIENGREKLEKHQVLFGNIEQKYGVPKNILVAFWGLETNYGSNKGKHNVASSLITLAYEGRRASFFRSQLIEAMKIHQAHHADIKTMRGSWAGAMGHMQFMPATFMQYAIDGDNNGKIDIWNSLPDAFTSAANYLSMIGWRKNEPVAVEVVLPKQFNYQQARLFNRKSTGEWSHMGITQANGSILPQLDNAAIVMPQGWDGPAFMVATNFDVVMNWNRSVNYALSVSHLATQFDGGQAIIHGKDVNRSALSLVQVKLLQSKLNELGYDSGFADGFPGLKTQGAIREYQINYQLPADGYASIDLLSKVLATEKKPDLSHVD